MGWAGSQSPQKKEKNRLNSPAFESRECLPRMGLPRSSFIIPQRSQPRSDPIWVIINSSQHSPACSSLAHRPSKLTALRSLFLLIMLFWKEERKESNFQSRCGGFLLTLPPRHPSGEGASHPPWSFPRKGLWFQFCVPKVNTDPCCQGRRPSPAPHTALGVVRVQFSPQRGLCPQPGEPHVPNATHSPRDGRDRGCGMEETSRDKEQKLLPPKPAREALGTLPFAPSPVLSHCTCLSLGCQAGGTPWGQSQAVTCCH